MADIRHRHRHRIFVIRSFSFLASSDWNSLDVDIRNASTLSQFRNAYLNMAFSNLAETIDSKPN